MTLLLTTLATPLGNLNLIADEHILLGANLSTLKALKESLSAEDAIREVRSVSKIPVITDLINDYFEGDISAINAIQVRQPGAHFSQAAWKAMKKVKAGSVISYGELAERAGSPAAVRAAGSACAKNAIVLVVPCHRIVKTGGALGNYAYGLNKKEWLLHHEGAL
ncbi:methylated-DNA--[protein]-cysteine S-methyltransferase [Candidatus Planktophila dulcis]|uniref:methylated-DNA--[protein]-cysteine S-methyltransferase n=1 Tax=Candidatus Planktophila dulcis TaxID=1884914 RepID=UPI003CFADBE9